jgi:gliding motility-associated-like protein/uncharacterized repeat protein (TIGR01451 family)
MITRRQFRLLTLCCALTMTIAGTAQNLLITHTLPDQLYVCGEDQFSIKVYNTSATAINAVTLTITFPAGLQYVSGTVSGATEQNIGNLSAPVFLLPELPGASNKDVTCVVRATCEAASVLDAAGLFQPQFKLTAGANVTQTVAMPFPVETGLLVVQSVDFPNLTGSRLDTLFRKICVKNTRLGAITNLSVEDEHLAGIETFFTGAATQNNTLTLGAAQYPPSFFTAFGDGDALLEINEVACFTERVVITDCGIPAWSLESKIRVGWGCDGMACRYDSTTIQVNITESDLVPALQFKPIWTPPVDNCGALPAQAGLLIKNTGRGDATSVFVEIDTELADLAGIDSMSFRVLNSGGGSTPIFPVSSTSNADFVCRKVLDKASVVVPFIAAEDSVRLVFDYYNCAPSCGVFLPGFLVNYFHTKPCPVGGFVSDTTFIEPDYRYAVNASLGLDLGTCVAVGEQVEIEVCVGSRRLVENDGYLRIDLELPTGFAPDAACPPVLAGQSPVQVALTGPADSTRSWQLAWKLPLPTDTVCQTFCLRFACGNAEVNCVNPKKFFPNVQFSVEPACFPGCFNPIFSHAYWTPTLQTAPACGIGGCDTALVALYPDIVCTILPTEGDTSGSVIDSLSLPGGTRYSWDFEAKRTNLGLPDNNDDRDADALTGVASASGVRRDRFLPGDTLCVRYFVTIDSGGGLFKLGRSIYHEIVGSDQVNAAFGNDLFALPSAKSVFADKNKFRFLNERIHLRYADGSTYDCVDKPRLDILEQQYLQVYKVNTFPPQVIDDIVTIRYSNTVHLDSLFDAGCLPKPNLNKGDTLFIYTNFALNFNHRPPSTNTPDPPLIGFRTAISYSKSPYAHNRYRFKRLQYSGFQEKRERNQFGIKPCENSAEIRPYRYSMSIARPNLFPFEVRPLSRITDYQQYVPPGLDASEVWIDSLVLQNQLLRIEDFPLTHSKQGNFVQVDFAPVFQDPLDEGFALKCSMRFPPLCNFPEPDSGKQYIGLRYTGALKTPDYQKDSLVQSLGYFSNHPKMRMESGDTMTFPAGEMFDLLFKMRNQRASPAPNAWLLVQTNSGLSSDFSLTQLPQNQPVGQQNGFFQLGNFNGFSNKDYRLSGKNRACDADTLRVLFGWGCTPTNALDANVCAVDTFFFVLEQQSPELELIPTQEDLNLQLCDPSEYFEFEMLNGKTGTAYDLLASVKLPPGASVLPGSAQYAYPVGATWLPLTDPTSSPGNVFAWDVSALVPAIGQNGLLGFDKAPQNSLRIRFKINADCGFVANSPVFYRVSGTEPCGQPSNTLVKPGTALQVQGLSTPYGVTVSLTPQGTGPLTCGSDPAYTAQLNLLGTPSAQDSVYVLLPSGLSYVQGSYAPGANAPSGPPTPTAQGFRLPLPTTLIGGGSLNFQFRATVAADAACDDATILVQTRVKSTAFCASSGTDCAVYVSTGEAALNVQVQRPIYALLGASITKNAANKSATLTFKNTGDVPISGFEYELWADADGNGTWGASDLLLKTVSVSASIAPGQQISNQAQFSTEQCLVFVVLSAGKACLCEDVVFAISEYKEAHSTLQSCTLAPVSLGVPTQTGFDYVWSGSGVFACDTCATTSFAPPLGTLPGSTLTLSLTEVNGVCKTVHEFKVAYSPVAAIGLANAVICEGQTVTLTAQPTGASYAWQGPGVLNPAAAQQNLKPGTSATYLLTATFANGCSSTASASVTVLSADTILYAPLTTCAGEAVEVLGQMTATAGTYSLKLQKQNGCDSLLRQVLVVLPKPYKEESRSFCVGDTLAVMDTLLTDPAVLCRQATAFNGCDSTYCLKVTHFPQPAVPDPDTLRGRVGERLEVSGPTGFSSYAWLPLPPNCAGCATFEVTYDSAGLYTYQLALRDINGCRDSVTYRIFVLPPCDPSNVLIPNAFTPDGDGVNERFVAFSPEKSELFAGITIYDRWGEKVFEGYDNQGWDGTIKGQPAPVDVYVYRVVVSCSDGEKAIWGDVTLIR